MLLALRSIITLAMLYFIYRETGPVTTFAFLMIVISNEALAYWMRTATKCMNELTNKGL